MFLWFFNDTVRLTGRGPRGGWLVALLWQAASRKHWHLLYQTGTHWVAAMQSAGWHFSPTASFCIWMHTEHAYFYLLSQGTLHSGYRNSYVTPQTKQSKRGTCGNTQSNHSQKYSSHFSPTVVENAGAQTGPMQTVPRPLHQQHNQRIKNLSVRKQHVQNWSCQGPQKAHAFSQGRTGLAALWHGCFLTTPGQGFGYFSEAVSLQHSDRLKTSFRSHGDWKDVCELVVTVLCLTLNVWSTA